MDVTPTPNEINRRQWDETPTLRKSNVNVYEEATPPHNNVSSSNDMNFGFDMRAITLDNIEAFKYDKTLQERNKPLTDEDINSYLPGLAEGYEIVPVPESYQQFFSNYHSSNEHSTNNNTNSNTYVIPSQLTHQY